MIERESRSLHDAVSRRRLAPPRPFAVDGLARDASFESEGLPSPLARPRACFAVPSLPNGMTARGVVEGHDQRPDRRLIEDRVERPKTMPAKKGRPYAIVRVTVDPGYSHSTGGQPVKPWPLRGSVRPSIAVGRSRQPRSKKWYRLPGSNGGPPDPQSGALTY